VSSNQILALMRRHLVAVVAILVLTVGIAWDIKSTPPPYTESANLIFTPPAVNPYFSLSSFRSALIATAEIMTKTMESPESQQKVHEAGGTADFSVGLVNYNNEQFPYYGNPYVTVTTTATNPVDAHRTFTIVVQSSQRLISERQVEAGVYPASRISTQIVGDTGSVAQPGSNKRAFAGLVLLAILIAFLVVIFLDRHPIRPSLRRRPDSSPSSGRARTADKVRLRG
jgi:hypothetical protein